MLRREDRSMRMSDYVDDVMTVFDKWRELVGLSETRASFYIFNGGSRAGTFGPARQYRLQDARQCDASLVRPLAAWT
jgi:hypothetical protein